MVGGNIKGGRAQSQNETVGAPRQVSGLQSDGTDVRLQKLEGNVYAAGTSLLTPLKKQQFCLR